MPVDPKIIYLEADEEITSVVDKLRKTEFNKVILVVPKEASLLQSIVNLKLLKRQAENLKKSIALVTTDKVGRNLAEKVGILAAAKIDESLKAAENFDLPEEVEEVLPESEPESENNPLEETNEVLYKDKKPERKAATKTKARDDDDDMIVIKEGEDEGLKEDPSGEKVHEEWGKKQINEPETDNLMPKFPAKKFMLIGGVILLVLLSLGFVFLPRVKATIMMKAEKEPVSLTFKGDKSASLDTDNSLIPAQVVEATKESSKSFQATGQKNVGTQAGGTLTVLNGSTSPVTLATFSPTGHSDLVYVASTPVTVNIGESKTVNVQAQNPGDQYNGFNNGSFYAVKANDPSILVRCYGGLSGGTTKQVTYVSQGDIDAAKSNLSADILDDARTDFNQKVANLKVIDDSKKEETVSVTANPDANSQASSFTMNIKVKISALAYSLGDVSKLVKASVDSQLGSTKQVIDDGADSANISVSDFDLKAGTFSGKINTTAYVSNKLDEDRIRTNLIAMNEEKAMDYLKGLDGVDTARVEFWPSFIKIFPRIKSHIYLSIGVSDSSKDN